MRSVLRTLTLCAAVFLCGCGGPKVTNHSFAVVYSNNIGGRIEPCGCRIPIGGMERRAGYLEEIREEVGDLLVLDGGVLYFGRIQIHDLLVEEAKLKADIIRESMSYMGLDAANVGSNDFRGGLDFLLELASRSDFPMLSVNLREKKSSKRIFPAYILEEVDGLDIAVFGVMADNFNGIKHFKDEDPYVISDFIEKSRDIIRELKSKAGFIIALANMEMYQAIDLARAAPEINLIIFSHLGPIKESEGHSRFRPFMEGRTLILRTPDDGRTIGRLDLKIRNGSLSFIEGSKIEELRQMNPAGKISTDTEQSIYVDRFTDLSSDYDGVEAIKGFIKSREPELEALAIEINTFESRRIPDFLKE